MEIKWSWDFYKVVDGLFEGYSLENNNGSLENRVKGFIDEVEREMGEYGGDRTDRIYRYTLYYIKELLNESEVV